jgi:hypothetical protein
MRQSDTPERDSRDPRTNAQYDEFREAVAREIAEGNARARKPSGYSQGGGREHFDPPQMSDASFKRRLSRLIRDRALEGNDWRLGDVRRWLRWQGFGAHEIRTIVKNAHPPPASFFGFGQFDQAARKLRSRLKAAAKRASLAFGWHKMDGPPLWRWLGLCRQAYREAKNEPVTPKGTRVTGSTINR